MKKMVPDNIENELYDSGLFTDINLLYSPDLIYEEEYYKNIELLNNNGWYAADSFWNHVKTMNEIEDFKNFINKLKENNQLVDYIEKEMY